MSYINKNNASHLSKLLFQEHTHTPCIFKVPWTIKKYQNPELSHEYNSQIFNKMSRKNTFWNKIKCCYIAHRFSHVFPAVGIQNENVKVQREFWKRFGEFADSEEDREGLGCHLGQGLWMPTAVKLQRRRSKAEEETSRAGCCVNVLRTVGPCGGSEVKNI